MANVINAKRNKVTPGIEGAHMNFMGGPSYFMSDPVAVLRMIAASSFFGEPQYYHVDKSDKRKKKPAYARRGGVSLTQEQVTYLRDTLNAVDPQEWRGFAPREVMERAIDAALDHSVERTLQEAVRLRNDAHIRVTPQVILVRAANHKAAKGTGLITQYAPNIIKRADEPATGLAYQLATYGRPIPNSLKKAWAKALRGFDEYRLGKYRLENLDVKTADVVRLVHANSGAIDLLMQDKLRTTGSTWEAIISERGSSQEAWTDAIDVMGHMGMLRNVRNMLDKGVAPSLFVARLKDGAVKGQQLPFRYLSALKAVEDKAPPQVLDAIEECLELSVGNLPKFSGRVASLCDNSGSAWGVTTSSMGTMHIAEIANLMAVLTGKAADEGYAGVFGDRLEMVPVRKKDSVLSQTQNLSQIGRGIGGGTENGIWLFLDKAIRDREHWDHLFIYSDMQAGHGGLYGTDVTQYSKFTWGGRYIDVPKLVAEYRKQVNPNVMVYMVQVAGYADVLMPEFYDKTFILGGWGEGILNFAAEMSEMCGQQSCGLDNPKENAV